ncbi:Hypothetical predicted protein [Olea europaea subsp. europaea]|uniref:Uncharacterized protein n=1 Tax=Olea europaea subsp. europaea TaxID=158383 RepID=A0A8S0T8M7_OLEEU|nr:Hypothetical predicted protein [Olea europaea subsp. europaea]
MHFTVEYENNRNRRSSNIVEVFQPQIFDSTVPKILCECGFGFLFMRKCKYVGNIHSQALTHFMKFLQLLFMLKALSLLEKKRSSLCTLFLIAFEAKILMGCDNHVSFGL